jgi:hypothetical protein
MQQQQQQQQQQCVVQPIRLVQFCNQLNPISRTDQQLPMIPHVAHCLQVKVLLPSRLLPQQRSLVGVAMTKSVEPGAAVAAAVVVAAAAGRVSVIRMLLGGSGGVWGGAVPC